MAQTKIVIVDCDESYLLMLERAFVREYQFFAELVLLSDENVMKTYFAEQKTIDILVIQESLYDQSFARHNVEHVFLLTEERNDKSDMLTNNTFYKYSSSKTILDGIISRTGISHATNLHSGQAKLIMVYSPAGGCGQTSVAVALSTLLARNFRRTLFVSIDGMQTVGEILNEPAVLVEGVENSLQQRSKYIYEKIKPLIVSQMFDVLPPFPKSLASMGITVSHMLFLIDLIQRSGDYDYIIVDGATDFTAETTRFMSEADHVLLVTTQTENAAHKLTCLTENIDCSDENRFAVVCNQYRPNEKSYLQQNADLFHGRLEYIEFDEKIAPQSGDYAVTLQSVQKLGQWYI